MQYYHREWHVETAGRELLVLTERLGDMVREAEVDHGLATVFLHHTSASLLLSENADATVLDDLERWFARAVPDGDALFRHAAEGPDDMPAHVRSVLTGNSLALPVRNGGLDLGTWQGVYLFEHRTRPHRRRVSATLLGS
ncbi:MAG: secondary thiamine-phosphate synthase enzyme YjbQ [Planctomycetota bacterium]